ncbi:hypothetical protein Tco_0018187 [Tanacetum coccineum]
MGKRAPEKNRCITVNLHHEGVFTVSPFEYSLGDEKQITDIYFEGMSYVQFRKVIVKLVHGPVVTLYYCKVGASLKLGIKIIKTDSDVDEFVNFGYRNKWQVNLYVKHSGYDDFDIRDREEIMADDSNESSDAYYSSDEEDLSYVDFHTEVDDNVIIKNVTTNDPFLNKLCPDSAQFLNVVDEPVFANDETVVEDSENIDPKFNVMSGVTYIRHDPNQNWKKMEPVLGMRFDNPEQLKMCLANYEVANRYQLWFYKNDWRKLLVYCGRDVEAGRCAGSLKVDEGTSKSPKTPVKAITSDPFIPTLKMKTGIREKFLINVSLGQCKRTKQRALFDYEGGLKEYYGRLWDHRQAILDSNPRSTCRLDDEETESGHYYFKRIYVCFKGVKEGWLAGCRKVIRLDGCFFKTLTGPIVRSCTESSNEMVSCTINSKPLVLPWRRTPQLDSGVRVNLGLPGGLPLSCGSVIWKPSVFLAASGPMSAITDIRCALTRKAFDAFFTKYHIPEEVHPVLPNQNDTIHERPTGKIGLHTRFFNYANFRLPLYSFLVDVLRDPAPAAADFSDQDYATLVALPSLFWKFPEEFLCLVGLSRHYTLDEETYPLFLDKDGEEQKEGELRLLETTVGRTVPLLPVAPDRGASELEASRKRKTVAVDAGESSHPPKKLREDHETPSGTSVGGKSRSSLQQLLVRAVLNAEVRGEVVPTLPFVTSSLSATSEREGEDHTNSVTGHNLRTIRAPQRFVIYSDSSHHSGANVAEAEVVMIVVTTTAPMTDPTVFVKEKTYKPSLFAVDSSSTGGADPNAGVFSNLTGSDFLVSGVRTVIDPDTDLQKVYVPQWSITNGSRLNDGRVYRELVDEFAPLKFFASVWGMDHDQLFTEFNVGAARQMSLSAEAMDEEIINLKAQMLLKEAEAVEAIRLRAEASIFEAATDLEASTMDKDRELVNLNAQLTSVKSQNDSLAHQVHELEVSSARLQEKLSSYENLTKRLEEFQDDRMREVNDKFDKLYADFIEMALHLEERFYPHLLTTISDRRWLLTHGMELAISKCLNSTKYRSDLGAAIGKDVEKGMQDGLSARITHGTEGRALTDVVAYNPSTEADYISALQHLQSVNFSLLAELRSNKDARIDTLMNIIRLEDTLAERLGLTESQCNAPTLKGRSITNMV